MKEEPDDCTTLNNCTPNDHCRDCSHAIYYGEVIANGRRRAFSFSPQYGVNFLDHEGHPLIRQPGEKHAAWEAFEIWRKAKFDE